MKTSGKIVQERHTHVQAHVQCHCIPKGQVVLYIFLYMFKTVKQKTWVRSVDQSESDNSDSSCAIEKLSINSVIKYDDCVVLLNIRVNGKDIQMELDTGSVESVILEEMFRELFGKQPLKSSNIKFPTYDRTLEKHWNQ